jgi:hypothetical protein
MSEDQQSDFFDRLKTLDLVVKLGWALLAGAFGLGIWVTSIQLELSNNTREATSHETRVRDLELKESVNSERLNTALKILERIDRKINP